MNRKDRRHAEKTGITKKFDPDSTYRLKFDIKLPPGLLRDGGPSQRAGQLDAENEVDLTRGVFVRLLETFGFIQNEQAIIGLFASVVNPFPKRMRGALAYAIIQGTGLMIDEQDVEVCTFCEAEKQQTLDLENQPPEDECGLCTAAQDEDVHTEHHKDWLHDYEEAEPVMIDTTQHLPTCQTIAVDEEGDRPVEDVEPPTWKEINAIVVLTPMMYEPLNQEGTETESEEEANEPIIDTLGTPDEAEQYEPVPIEIDPGMDETVKPAKE